MKQIIEYLQGEEWNNHLTSAIQEDFGSGIGSGDHSSLACFDKDEFGKAHLKAKENGIIAGLNLVPHIFQAIDPAISCKHYVVDGDSISNGKILLTATGPVSSLLGAERIMLNYTQRLSGIATLTKKIIKQIEGTPCKLLDTRKTTPGWRILEKYAVNIGGGFNHRMGLHDYIMLKDNHVDYCGGIKEALARTSKYLKNNNLFREIEVEVRNINEVKEALNEKNINRIMLDNFSPKMCFEAVRIINGAKEIEVSGGITEDNIREYALSGVDFISVGALTHSSKNLDLNFKADF
ncbi:MAG: carboxylating nicotinate-nucleotide diphosphorylase [Schleiferiaceae bacterium]|nr:carboxylating nicotinate-nucleotide diphosphorylase [Schleiferiaceae bacterium]